MIIKEYSVSAGVLEKHFVDAQPCVKAASQSSVSDRP